MTLLEDRQQELTGRDSVLLADGTLLRDLIDLERREIALRVFSDPEIYKLELERIFARHWIWLAHESEIPNAGDFVLRNLGEDSVIVTRGKDGEINLLLNVCAHRGMEVCRADSGNAESFNCPYHAWNYGLNGKLLGAPFEKLMYGDWDKSGYGLQTLPVEVRHGLIFGSGAQEPISFDEYLGDFAWYLDVMFADTEWEPLGPRDHYVFKGNWKMRADQNSGDLYHVLGAHRAIAEIGGPMGAMMSDVEGALDILKVGFPQGHTIFTMGISRARQQGSTIMGPAGDRPKPVSDEPEPYAFDGASFSGLLWPFTKVSGSVDRAHATLDSMVPFGPGGMDGSSLTLVRKGTPEEVKAAMRVGHSFGGSVIGADDASCWTSMQRGASGVLGRRITAKYNAIRTPNKPDSWPGPGETFAGFSRDDNQWGFWLKWFDMMTQDAW